MLMVRALFCFIPRRCAEYQRILVVTKVIVYCGIAVLACEWLPVMFEVLGWGVRSS